MLTNNNEVIVLILKNSWTNGYPQCYYFPLKFQLFVYKKTRHVVQLDQFILECSPVTGSQCEIRKFFRFVFLLLPFALVLSLRSGVSRSFFSCDDLGRLFFRFRPSITR